MKTQRIVIAVVTRQPYCVELPLVFMWVVFDLPSSKATGYKHDACDSEYYATEYRTNLLNLSGGANKYRTPDTQYYGDNNRWRRKANPSI